MNHTGAPVACQPKARPAWFPGYTQNAASGIHGLPGARR